MVLIEDQIEAKAKELKETIRKDAYGFGAAAVLALNVELTLLLAEKVRRDASDFCSLEKEG